MICFDVYLNGEKLCRAGKKELVVLSTHVDFVEPKYEDDDPLTVTVGGLYEHPTSGNVHPRWIQRRRLDLGDEVTFSIVDSDTADAPVEEEISEPGWQEEQQRKYYQFLKAKYEGKNKDLRISDLEEERIPQLLDVATVWIDEAADVAARLDGERRGKVIRQLGTALGSILQAKSIMGVEAEPAEELPKPDGPMTPEQQSRVDQLTSEEIESIDKALLANCSHQFRKLARVVGMAMDTPIQKKRIPDLFYAERIRHLVSEGKLESQGNLNYMRFSEVRLATE